MTRSKKIIIGGFIVVAITFAMAFGCMLGLNLNNQVQTAYALDTISVSNVYYFDGYNDVSFGTTMPTGYTFSDGTLTIADGATPYEILTKGKGNLAVKFEGDYGNNTISISNEVGELTLTSTTPVDVTLAGLYSAEMIHIEGKVNLTITGPSYSGSMDGQYSKFLVGCLYGTLYVEDDASVTAIDPVLHGKTISDTSFEAIFKVGALVLNTTGCFKVGLNSTSTSTDEAYAIKVIDNGFSPVSYSSCDNGFVLYSNANKFICIGDSADDLDYADYQTELEKKLKTIEDGNSLTIRRCQVSFDANTGSGTMDNEMSYKGNYSLPNCSFTAPSGKRFKCWAVGSASGTQYNAGASYTITDDVTFYAVWEDIPRAFTTQPQGIATKEIGQTHQISWAVNFDAVEYGVYFWNGSAWQEMYRYDSAITPAGTVMTYNITHDAAGEMRYNVDCYYTEFDYITSEEFTITWQDNTPAPVVVNGQSPVFSG